MQITLNLAKEATAQPGSAMEKLRWLTTQLLPYQYEQPEGVLPLVHAMVNEAVPARIRQMTLKYSLDIQTVVQEIMAQGQAEGEIRQASPIQLTILYIANFQGLATAASYMDGQTECLPDAETLLSFLRT